MIYFMRILNTGVLLVSNGKSSVIYFVHALMTRMNTHELDTRTKFTINGI